MIIDIDDPEMDLGALVADAEAGKTVVLGRGGRPAVRLGPVSPPSFRFDALRSMVPVAPDFDDPLDDDDLASWEGGR
jgi:antitoxin (DNA-binding transcriptional repressor) of toxin-antitoxin stability system